MPKLEEQIKVVAEARKKADIASKGVEKAREEWEEEHYIIIALSAALKEQRTIAEALLRELTLQAYAETGNKNPAIGVSVKIFKKLGYDPKEAFDWATEHKVALKLDVSAFESIAKAAPETRPGFVTITTEPQAQIATDLEEVLDESD